MWHEFCAASAIDPDSRCDVYAFGDSPAMADELANLVLHGPKRATAGLVSDFVGDADPAPVIGAHAIILDGQGDPVCVVRTSQVDIKPITEVDESFAWDEGEGDRTLQWWLNAHRAYFNRQARGRGEEFDEAEPCVLERFELVWPRTR
jgi:uncharacterized protein YhfF